MSFTFWWIKIIPTPIQISTRTDVLSQQNGSSMVLYLPYSFNRISKKLFWETETWALEIRQSDNVLAHLLITAIPLLFCAIGRNRRQTGCVYIKKNISLQVSFISGLQSLQELPITSVWLSVCIHILVKCAYFRYNFLETLLVLQNKWTTRVVQYIF